MIIIVRTVRAFYSDKLDYSGLTTELIKLNLPIYMIYKDNIYHAFNSKIEINAVKDMHGNVNGDYTITLYDIPRDACQRMGVMNLGDVIIFLSINGNKYMFPMEMRDVNAACVDFNEIKWTYL